MANSIFTGSSRYSSDFQAVIDRTIAFASLPLRQMEQSKAATDEETAAIKVLDARVASLQAAMAAIERSVGLGGYSTTASDPSIVRLLSTDGAREGSYNLEVVSLGSATTALSKSTLPKVTNPATTSLASAGTFTLRIDDLADGVGVNATSITITPGAATLDALADSINAAAPQYVQATIVNVGSTDVPDYRLSVQSKQLGQLYIQLNDGTRDLIDIDPVAADLGTRATYKVNGSALIESTSRTLTLSQMLSVEMLKAGTSTITVARSASSFTDAINSFISAYNSVVDAVDLHRGNAESALSGDSLLSTVQQMLKQITSFEGTGALKNLAAIGIAFDKTGRLFIDSTIYPASVSTKLDDLKSFVGKSDTVGSFIKTANEVFQALTDNSKGVLKLAATASVNTSKSQAARIFAEQERIAELTESIQQRMYAADAMIAMLEQQVTYFNGMWAAMKSANESMK